MAFEPGGRADKLGNRYEGRWVAKQLLRLLNEDINSVTIEAIGDDERGVDLWIELTIGKRLAQQCKARNQSKEYWTVADLNNRGILRYLQYQLDRKPDIEYVLISGVPATQIGDICDSARNSNDNPKDFYQYQIKKVGETRTKPFSQFCSGLCLNSENPQDLAKAHNYLKRTRFELFPYDDNTWQDLLTSASFLLTDKPEKVIATLATYAENQDRLGQPIYRQELASYLEAHYIYPKNLAYDHRISPTITRLQREFEESIEPALINKKLIHREESDECLKALTEFGIVILHGTAGTGKSGVLYELTCKLKNIPWLPICLDRRMPQNTAKHFGENMGLPDSPAHCLAAMAGERFCVLILDQLDDIRWTSSHSANALDVCKELVSQVVSFRRERKSISVVLSCRTFDLQHDPEIRNWLNAKQDNRWTNIEVKSLTESSVLKIVGVAFENMTQRQKDILSNPQNLSMWVELSEQEKLMPFHSVAALMREFWRFKKEKMARSDISINDINNALDTVVDYLEKEIKLSAPVRIVSKSSPKAVEALRSHGIILEQNKLINFCHQSYLDFLIAERLLTEIMDKDGSILNWLDVKDRQTLFRREQLRQTLALLSEESPGKFLETVKAILSSERVRFHIKHLVLELTGQIEDVSDALFGYFIQLLKNYYWLPHIIETVFYGHPVFIQNLIQQGTIANWLKSDNETYINQALWLLRSVAEKIPDHVTEQLVPFVESGEKWQQRILNTISWHIEKDSDAMFDLRLQLARKGVVSDLVNWRVLCAKHPLRALQLIETILSTWQTDKDSSILKQRARLGNWYEQDFQALSEAAECYPQETWDLFMPHIERLTSINVPSYGDRLRKWKRKIVLSKDSTNIARGTVELTILAGKKLAKERTEMLLERTKPLENSLSLIIQGIIMEVYTHLPEQYADIGISWLLADLNRLGLGNGYNEPKWIPASRLIKALSPHCSQVLFIRLEHEIVHYHSPDEKQLAEYYLTGWKKGKFKHYWRQAQYFLLPAFSADRIVNSTANLISVLKRRFDGYNESDFLRRPKSSGGWIGSKLDKNLKQISDSSWIDIIRNKDLKVESSPDKWKVDKDHIVTADIEQFSRSLSKIAKRFPERFGQLALQFPEDTHPSYVSAIIDAMVLVKPDSDVPEDEKSAWEPAKIDTVIAVLNRFCNINEREFAMSFCKLIRSRASETWPDSAIKQLLYFATSHSDLEPGKLNVHCDKTAAEASVEMLFQNTINCVRGVAAEAIGALLWHHSDWLDKLKPGIESLITDHHPAVRMAAINALLPVLNIDRAQAVTWFCKACEQDERVSASPYAANFLSYTISKFSNQLCSVIYKMVNSTFPDVAEHGAKYATAYCLSYGLFTNEVELCSTGTIPQRKGVAHIAARFITDDKYSKKCQKLIEPFFNDPDKEVRTETASLFNDKFFNLPESYSLAVKFVKSKAFADDTFHFMHCLQNYKHSLLQYHEIIFAICNELSTTLLAASRDFQTSIVHGTRDISPLLLRLYEQAQGQKPDIACRCLDVWDVFFEKRVGITRELTKAI